MNCSVSKWMLKWVSTLFNHYHFSLNVLASAVLILTSYLGGTLIYEKIIANKQEGLLKAYGHVDVICEILSENPKFAQGPCSKKLQPNDQDKESKRRAASDSPFNLEVLRYLYEKAELYDPDDVNDGDQLLNAEEMPGTAYLTNILMADDPANSPFLMLGKASSLELIAHIAKSLGDESCTLADGAETEINLPRVLAIGMSQIQYKGVTPLESIQIQNCELPEYPVDGAVYQSNKQAISDNDLLSYLWTLVHANNAEQVHSNIGDVNQWGNPRGKVTSMKIIEVGSGGTLSHGENVSTISPENIDKIYDKSRTYSQFLMGKIQSSELIAEKRKDLVMFRGFEQQIMLCLLIFVLLVIFVRFVYRKLQESLLKELDDHVLEINIPAKPDVKKAQIVGDDKQVQHSSTSGLRKHTTDNPEPQARQGVEVPVEIDNDKKLENYRLDALKNLKRALNEFEALGLTKNIVFKTGVMIKNKLCHPFEDDVDKMRNALTLDTERLYNSRWVVRWIAITIPAIGFVGTVRGILQSLSQADVIVWASTQSERAAAIGEISSELGLAFATTLIALIIGIGISIFNEHQSKNESNFVFLLEEISSKFLDYRYRGIDSEISHEKG